MGPLPISRRAFQVSLATTLAGLRPVPMLAAPQPRPQREVLAFYYGWYATPAVSGYWRHWPRSDGPNQGWEPTHNTPLFGPYDSHDCKLVLQQIAWARQAGITGFIASWWGPSSFQDQGMRLLLEVAHANGLKVAAYIEMPRQNVAEAQSDLRYIVQEYGGHPAWLRAHGQPVVFLYARALSGSNPVFWRQAADRLRGEGLASPLLVGDMSFRNPTQIRERLPLMDGMHTYVIAPIIQNMTPQQMGDWASTAYPKLRSITANKIFCAPVMPGYDDSKVPGRPRPRPIVARNGGETYEVLWTEAIRADPDWILITSWNEWHEGSEIEPSKEYGDAALNATWKFSARFLGRS